LITERQLEYIKILSSYEHTAKEDQADISAYLKTHKKQELEQLSKSEASELIQILLKRPTEYYFVCGKTVMLDKKEVNGFNVLGELEACLHACPLGLNVNDCSDLEKWLNKKIEREESEHSKQSQDS
jgi:hypothetical protein